MLRVERNGALARLISAVVSVALVNGQLLPSPSDSAAAPMDLVWDGLDANGIPMNPDWRHYVSTGSLPDPEQLCAGGPSGFSLCTSQPVSFDTSFVCTLQPGYTDGHVNWPVPVTYEGQVYWADQSCIVCDNDTSLELVPVKKNAGLTKTNDGSLHLEFDAGETVARFSTPWWRSFRNAIAGVGNPIGQFVKIAGTASLAGAAIGGAIARSGKGAAIGAAAGAAAGAGVQTVLRTRGKTEDKAIKALIDGKFAIVTGVMGLDCEHTCAAEIHPVWAIAIHVREDPSDDVWAIFVRSWGNEGMCSEQQHYARLHQNRFVFSLPWRNGAANASVIDSKTTFLSNSSLAHDVNVIPGKAVTIEFQDWPEPESRPLVHGELHLQWSYSGASALAEAKRGAKASANAPKSPPASLMPGKPPDERPDSEERVAAAEAQMTKKQRTQYRKMVPVPRPPADRLPTKASGPRPEQLTLAAPPPAQPAGVESVPDIDSSNTREQRLKALCASYDNNIPDEWLQRVCASHSPEPSKR
jgi:hypothetical protein